jgi:hypothetical protein
MTGLARRQPLPPGPFDHTSPPDAKDETTSKREGQYDETATTSKD